MEAEPDFADVVPELQEEGQLKPDRKFYCLHLTSRNMRLTIFAVSATVNGETISVMDHCLIVQSC